MTLQPILLQYPNNAVHHIESQFARNHDLYALEWCPEYAGLLWQLPSQYRLLEGLQSHGRS